MRVWSQEKTFRPPDMGTWKKSFWDKGEIPRVPACQAWPLHWASSLVLWAGSRHWGDTIVSIREGLHSSCKGTSGEKGRS